MAKLKSESRQYRMQINAAVTVFKKRPLAKITKQMVTDPKTGLIGEVIIDEDEVVDREFAVEFKGNKIKAHRLRAALNNLLQVIEQDMRKLGLVES